VNAMVSVPIKMTNPSTNSKCMVSNSDWTYVQEIVNNTHNVDSLI
jgi:hypothetical protein